MRRRPGVTPKIQEIQAWKAQRGWSNAKLSREMGVSDAALSRLFSGKRYAGGMVIAGIMKVTGCPFETFFEV